MVGEEQRVFERQFILSGDETILPAFWPSVEVGRYHLAHHPNLPAVKVSETNTRGHRGFMLGWPVSSEGYLVKSPIQLPFFESEKELRNELYRYSGSWACIIQVENELQVYGDAFHSQPIVYSSDFSVVASSTGLIQERYRGEKRSIVDKLDIPNRDNWYPFGLTPYRECWRLLPNHCLNLGEEKVVRHWPCPDTFGGYSNSQLRSSIIEGVKRNIRAFVENGRPYLSLTAGRDSRLLLACSKEVKNEITCHTLRFPNQGSLVDAQVAGYIARRFGINYLIQSYTPPNPEDLERWLVRTGYCVAGGTWRNATTLKELDGARARFAGIGGEIGRAYCYRPTDHNETQLSPRGLVERLSLPVTEELCSVASDWLADAPDLNTFHLLDLLYLEQRIGCWASVTSLGHADSAYIIFPFCDRKIVQALVSLDEEQKRSETWMADAIEATWPELLEIPFDQYVGWARIKHGISRRLTAGYAYSLAKRAYRKVQRFVREKPEP